MSEATDFYAALGQCVSAAAGVFGLGFIGWQIKVAGRATDFQTLQSFLRDAREHEQALLTSLEDEARDMAFIDYLNFLEVYASALHRKLFYKTTKELVRDKLVDALALISIMPDWHSKFEKAITSQSTFSSIGVFMRKHRTAIQSSIEASKGIAAT